MSTRPTTQQSAPHSALRRLVARHPVAAFLVMVYAVTIAVVLPPVLTRHDIWPLLFTVVVPQLLLFIVFSNGPEEIGWMGFLQARLQERHGPLKASVIATLPFALYHLPGLMVDEGLSLAQLPLALGLLGALAILQLFGRIVMMWLYHTPNRRCLWVG